MAKFYVSCTTKDLGEGRRKVCNILRSAGHDVVSMDIYTSESRPSLVKCREDVEKCDVYLGIFALRYGWRPPNKEAPGDNPLGRAITELEYLHAKARGKDRLIFILDEEQALWRAALIDRDRAAIDDVAFVDGYLVLDVEQPSGKQRRHFARKDVNVGTLGHESLHEVRADEAGAACYEDVRVPERVHGPFPSTTSEVSSSASLYVSIDFQKPRCWYA